MPAFTNFLGLYKPGGGSTGLILPDEVVDIDRINSNMDAIDLFAKGWGQSADRNHQFYGPAASLAGVTGMKLGDTYQESDGNKALWKYDGSNWVPAQGTQVIRPSSVVGTGATLNPDGSITVTGTALTTVRIHGLFPAWAKNVNVRARIVCSSGTFLDSRLCYPGGGTTGAFYSGQYSALTSGAVSATAYTSTVAFRSSPVSAGEHAVDIDFFDPGDASSRTLYEGSVANFNMGNGSGLIGGGYATLEAHDGLLFALGAGYIQRLDVQAYGYAR